MALALALGGLLLAQNHGGAAQTTDAALRARIVAFLNRSLGWQGLDKLEVESISAPDASGLRTAKVMLAKGEQRQEATYLITSDGREIIEGQVNELSGDPWKDTRAQLELAGAPSIGAADAPVTIVEFSDLECPYCKQESATLDQLMNAEPGKFRVVFKYYPLIAIHPWSMQAAKTAVCVAQQNPAQFWNFERSVFGAQEQITPETAATRLRDFAEESGAKPDLLNACLAAPATQQAVEASIANGKRVGVTSTPTLFINGRIIPGAVAEEQLKLLVNHEAGFAARSTAGLSATPKGQQCGECKPLPKIKH